LCRKAVVREGTPAGLGWPKAKAGGRVADEDKALAGDKAAVAGGGVVVAADRAGNVPVRSAAKPSRTSRECRAPRQPVPTAGSP
jgi:hypothetical protein